MNLYTQLTKQFLKIFANAVSKKIYGSVEIYFEEGRVTQITQRIINKIQSNNNQKKNPPKRINMIKGDKGDSVRNTLLTS